MGVVTLFCNISAAIGFAVFALTKSEILKEFGAVAGINIFLLFFVSLILIPVVLSYSSAPKASELKYLDNKLLKNWLTKLETWSLSHRKPIYIVTALVLLVSIAGLTRLKTLAYIVDDLPKTDKIYTDLKYFEQHFEGVMPLEVVVDTKKKYGVSRNLNNLEKIDSLATFLSAKDYIGRSLSITEGLKFAKQAFFEGDSTNYSMPSDYDLPAMAGYLSVRKGEPKNAFTTLVSSFMDSARQTARISTSMKDIGSERLPKVLDSIQRRVNELFPAENYSVQLTGTSVTFLEGSHYIINGLKESILSC
jgi:predicted RND superfamily exporter protein